MRRQTSIAVGPRRLGGVIALIALAVGLVTALTALDPARAGPAAASSPAITSVSPTSGLNNQSTAITIAGSDFQSNAAVFLGGLSLAAGFVDTTTLTATVPANLPAGAYTVTVANPDGGTAARADAFTARSSGDGSLGPWEVQAPLELAVSQPGATVAGNRVYVVGGHISGPGTVELGKAVQWTTIDAAGRIAGRWQVANPLNAPQANPAVIAANGFLYAVSGPAERAAINPDGSLGSWQPETSTFTRTRSAAVEVNGWIYLIGGVDGVPVAAVERAKINPNGSLGVWQTSSSLINRRSRHAAVAAGGWIYVIGGYDTRGAMTSVERAPVNPDGSLGPWQETTPLPAAMERNPAVVARGYLDYGPGPRAPIRADGSLGDWAATTVPNHGRADRAAVTRGDYIYSIDDTSAKVERAEVNPVRLYTASPLLAASTAATEATFTGTNFLAAPAVRLGTAVTLTTRLVDATTVTATLPTGLASGWYTATLTNGDGRPADTHGRPGRLTSRLSFADRFPGSKAEPNSPGFRFDQIAKLR